MPGKWSTTQRKINTMQYRLIAAAIRQQTASATDAAMWLVALKSPTIAETAPKPDTAKIAMIAKSATANPIV